MHKLTAEELTAAIAVVHRDHGARARLFEHYRPYLLLIAQSSIAAAVQRREDASDVVQQTMIEAAAAVESFNGRTEPEFSAWIKQILRRNVINAVRDHHAAKRDVRREQGLDTSDSSATLSWQLPASETSSPSLKVIKAEAALNLARCLEGLPDDQRCAVVMRHLEGRSLEEIAKSMDKTLAAVAGLIRRGVRRLREELADSTVL